MTQDPAGPPGAPVLFRSDDLLVRRGAAFGGPVCVVTFAHFTHDRSLDRPGFGEDFLAAHAIDAIHVNCRTNAWFDYAEMDAALAAAAEAAAGFARVVTYGSSMGGYAAVRFAEALGAQAAIALSPQYGVDRTSAPFERRFVVERGTGRLAPRHGSARVAPHLLFDPLDLDARHAALIAAAYPRTARLPLRHAGHPAGAYLAETQMLAGAVLDIVHDRFDPAAFVREARLRRRRSSQYLFTLARRLGPAHRSAKRSLVKAAIAQRDDAVYRLFLAVLLELDGDLQGAEQELATARGMVPDHPIAAYAEASFLMRRGRWAAAEAVAQDLVRRWPENHRFTQILAVARARGGGPPPGPTPQMAASLPARAGWSAWLRLIRLLARLEARGVAPLPRWHQRYFSLSREVELIDEWASRRRGRRARRY